MLGGKCLSSILVMTSSGEHWSDCAYEAVVYGWYLVVIVVVVVFGLVVLATG